MPVQRHDEKLFVEISGPNLCSDMAKADEVAMHLKTCFPAQMEGMSTHDTLEEGIGFHDMKDTIWMLLYIRTNGERSNTTTTTTTTTTSSTVLHVLNLAGAITAVIYHDGIYLSNLSVSPKFRNKGFGLDLLEQAGLFAAKNGKSRLIGNAAINSSSAGSSSNRSRNRIGKGVDIVRYYESLGAQVIQTGMGRNDSQGSHILSSVRMKRDIPSTGPGGVLSFFQYLRDGRRRKRWNRNASLVTGGCVLAIFAAHFARSSSDKNSNTRN